MFTIQNWPKLPCVGPGNHLKKGQTDSFTGDLSCLNGLYNIIKLVDEPSFFARIDNPDKYGLRVKFDLLVTYVFVPKQLQAEKEKAANKIEILEDEIDALKNRVRRLQDKAEDEVPLSVRTFCLVG